MPEMHHLASAGPAGEPELDQAAQEAEQEAERIRLKRQRVRSLALAWGLAALALLFFVVTLVHLGANVMNRPL